MTTRFSNMTIFDYLDNDIEQYKKVPPTKIFSYTVNSLFSKTYLLPIFEHVKTLKNENEIEEYFKNIFYVGKRDSVPYADFKRFLVGKKESNLMLHLDDFKDFIFILNHCGAMMGGRVMLDELIYPPGMTADDYRKSLKVKEIEQIISDSIRLCGLHSNSTSTKEFVNDRLKDYGIDYVVGEKEVII